MKVNINGLILIDSQDYWVLSSDSFSWLIGIDAGSRFLSSEDLFYQKVKENSNVDLLNYVVMFSCELIDFSFEKYEHIFSNKYVNFWFDKFIDIRFSMPYNWYPRIGGKKYAVLEKDFCDDVLYRFTSEDLELEERFKISKEDTFLDARIKESRIKSRLEQENRPSNSGFKFL